MKTKYSDLEGLHYGYVSRYMLTKEQDKGTIKPISTFSDFNSDNFKLPLKVMGKMIHAGMYFEPKYGKIGLPAEELKKVYKEWEGKKIYKYHDAFWKMLNKPEETSVDSIAGKIVQTMWNEEEQGIDYFAEIYDRAIAYKIYTRVISGVSVGFGNDVDFSGEIPMKVDIQPQELSLVDNPKDKSADVKVREIEFQD